MDIAFYILGGIALIIGLVGCVAPVIPGPPIGYIGIILLQLSDKHPFSTAFMVGAAILVAAVTLLDYMIPAMGTKKFGGTKKGMWGSTLGLLAGMFVISFGPLGLGGLLVGPFIGAYLGEKIAHNPHPWKAAFGSFIGFLAGTLLKIIFGIVVIVIAIVALLK